jgi:hypothetical protein
MRRDGTAGFLVDLVCVLTGIGCFFAIGFVSETFVAVALAAVALVEPVARVEAAFEVDDFNDDAFCSTIFGATVFGAAAFVVVTFDTDVANFPDSGSAFFGRPRRAGALRTLVINSDSGVTVSPVPWARCARVRTISIVGRSSNGSGEKLFWKA